MSCGVFVAGTDTGIGKTIVTAGIVRWLRNQGIDAVPMKPVQTGGKQNVTRLISPDLEFCLSVSHIQPNHHEVQLMSPYIYEPACSPHLAGRMANRYVQLSKIKDCAEKLLQNHQALVIEGAGGIMVPVNENSTMLDLIKLLGYPVMLVSRFGLGTINHTLLSVQALRMSDVRLIGLVFNRTERPESENQLIEKDNPRTITRFSNVRVLGEIRYLDNLSSGNTWQQFEEDMTGLKDILDELRV